MKTKAYSIVIVLALLIYWLGLCNASAFYDPGTQRWLNRDNIQESGGINLFQFAENNPLQFVDPEGRNCFSLSDVLNQIAALQAQYNQLVNQAAEFELQATLLYHEYKDPKSLGYQSIATYELYILAKQWRNQSVSQAKAIASQITNLQKWGAFLDGAATAGRACLCVPAEVVGAVAGLVFPVWQDPTQYGPGHVY